MSIAMSILVVLAQCAALLLDFVVVLIGVRAICSLRPVPWFVEFDAAGKPLVDRATRSAGACWERAFPDRPLFGRRLLLMTLLCALLLRWMVHGLLVVALG